MPHATFESVGHTKENIMDNYARNSNRNLTSRVGVQEEEEHVVSAIAYKSESRTVCCVDLELEDVHQGSQW